MKYTVLVHFQFMHDEGKLLEDKLINYPFAASLVPNLFDPSMTFKEGGKIFERLHRKDNYYPEPAKRLFREKFDELEIPVFIEGYRHCCEPCFIKGKDPYHEYVCVNGDSQKFETQKENTSKGISLLKKNLGDNIKIAGQVPPNHQGNEDTQEVARQLNLENFVIRNGFDYSLWNIELPVWKEDGLVILPESKNVGKSPLFYVMYDRLKNWEKYKPIFDGSVHLSELKKEIGDKPKTTYMSESLVYLAKKVRDLKLR